MQGFLYTKYEVLPPKKPTCFVQNITMVMIIIIIPIIVLLQMGKALALFGLTQ